jgi:tetratricopeptide (TPR) repeat protein
MQRASALNPANLALQESYGRSLIEAGRDTDAYAQFQKTIARWPRNADALVDYGMLAHRLGHDEEAVDNWQRAVDVGLALVHLADLQEKQADIRGAAESYQHALQLDAALSDPRSTASDWFNYAQFLRKQKQPERYIFCLPTIFGLSSDATIPSCYAPPRLAMVCRSHFNRGCVKRH